MSKFGIMLYLVPNLAPCIAFAKFNVKFGIALENTFYVKMPNFSIGTQIWHCIGDALILWKVQVFVMVLCVVDFCEKIMNFSKAIPLSYDGSTTSTISPPSMVFAVGSQICAQTQFYRLSDAYYL